HSGADAGMLIRRDRTPTVSNFTASNGSTVSLYAVTDWQHSVMAVVDGSGSVQERYIYDPFGKVEVLDASWNRLAPGTGASVHAWLFGGSALDWNMLHHTQMRDGFTGGYLAGSSIYDSGRDHMFQAQRVLQERSYNMQVGSKPENGWDYVPVVGFLRSAYYDWNDGWKWSAVAEVG